MVADPHSIGAMPQRGVASPVPAPPPAGSGRQNFLGENGLGFDDILDLINPLQHIPVPSAFYRAASGDAAATTPPWPSRLPNTNVSFAANVAQHSGPGVTLMVLQAVDTALDKYEGAGHAGDAYQRERDDERPRRVDTTL